MNAAKGNGHDLAKGQPAEFLTQYKSAADFASTERQRKEKSTLGARLGLEVIHG